MYRTNRGICNGSSNPICEGNLTLTGGATGATSWSWTGPNGYTSSSQSPTITGITTAGAGVYTLTASNTCGSASAVNTASVTVTPNNTITLTSAAGTNNQIKCINTAITNITYSTTGATGATFSGLPAGVTGSWAANVVTISGTPTASGTFNYTVTLTGGCGTVTATGTITVTPNNTITLTSAAETNNQIICINTAITNITYSTTGATGATFSGLPAGVTGSWAANVVTISGTPTASGTFNYTVTLTGGCGTVTATGTITVNAASVGGTAASAQTICTGSSPANITLTGYTGTIQWQYSNNGSTGWTNISGATSTPLTSAQMGTLTANRWYRAVVTNSPCASANSNSVKITVTPNNTITLTSAAETNNQIICINTAITNITYSTTEPQEQRFRAYLPGNWQLGCECCNNQRHTDCKRNI